VDRDHGHVGCLFHQAPTDAVDDEARFHSRQEPCHHAVTIASLESSDQARDGRELRREVLPLGGVLSEATVG
jgi:hypothetical protein